MRRILLSLALVTVLLGITVGPAPEASAIGTGAISGTVSIADVGPAVGLWAQAYLDNGTGTYSPVAATQTSSNGTYIISALDAGTYKVKFFDTTSNSTLAPTWYGSTDANFATTFSVPAFGTVTGVNGILNPGGTINFATVGGAMKTPLAGVSVVVSRLFDATFTPLTGVTSGTGDLTIRQIPPGSYTVAFSKSGGYFSEYWNNFQTQNNYDQLVVGTGQVYSLPVWLRTDQPASATYFSDVPVGASFFTEIEWMGSTRVSTGTAVTYERPLYKPVDPVSRQAMALFLQRIAGTVEAFTPPVTPTFADVPVGHPFYAAIEWMYAAGVSTGSPNPISGEKPLYNPSAPVSRQAMALFMYRLIGATYVIPETGHFADVPTSSSYYEAIEWMYLANISTGTAQPSGLPLYKPTDAVSRQAMAAFLYRYVQNAGG